MLKPEMQAAFDAQIGKELYSALFYLQMAAWAERHGFPGLSHWLKVQYLEEQAHALKFFAFVHDRDGTVRIGAVPAPPADWADPLSLWEAVAAHEAEVTESIHALVDRALKVGDHAAYAFLQWFVTEQVEEEATVRTFRDKLRLVGSDGRGLLMIDAELAARPVTALDPTALPV